MAGDEYRGKEIDDLLAEGFKLLSTFKVYHLGWELDATGWVVKKPNGKRAILLTNHGSLYEAESNELVGMRDSLFGAIAELERALKIYLGKE